MSTPLLVADTGPLIALARLDLMALPSRLYSEVLVTQTVWHELTVAPRADEMRALTAARQADFLTVIDDPTSVPASLADVRLDAGERSAFIAALLRQAAVLMDERQGRAVAASVNLPVIGTLGLLVRARRLGFVGPVRPLTEALTGSGYFLAPTLVDQALASIGE
jgi:predicted nucleic acid-binding protein